MNADRKSPLNTAIADIEEPNLRFETCKSLLNNNPDINHRIEETHPMHLFLDLKYSCKVEGNKKLLQLLIDKSTNVDGECKELKNRALFKAVKASDLIAARILLEAGAYPNLNVIFWKYATIENVAALKLFIRFNADSNDPRVFSYAMKNELWDILSLIIEYGDGLGKICSSRSNPQWLLELLLYRIHYERVDIIEYLLDNALDINIFATDSYFNILRKVYPRCSEGSRNKLLVRFSPKKCKMLHVAMKHVAIVMEFGKFSIRESTLQLIKDTEPLQKYFEKYLKQVKLMKISFVHGNFNITYFDLLTKTGKQLIKCCDPKIVDALSKDRVKSMFPDFADKLLNHFQRGVELRIVFDDFKQMLYSILKLKLSFDLVCYICDFLQMKDLKVFLLRDIGL